MGVPELTFTVWIGCGTKCLKYLNCDTDSHTERLKRGSLCNLMEKFYFERNYLCAESEYNYLHHALSYSQKIEVREIKGGQYSDFAYGKTCVYGF